MHEYEICFVDPPRADDYGRFDGGLIALGYGLSQKGPERMVGRELAAQAKFNSECLQALTTLNNSLAALDDNQDARTEELIQAVAAGRAGTCQDAPRQN